ncbi:hypothetical protein L2E82_12840 [Cichorium intybus]|uniref:Uncharacterized protein n=1 Tax=Cichorium intybus TaxID=13427 RepID=A0ACB9GGM9_CICIN|nr:hypothetical protein L2E82_12840 [Cichorium intybus]
MADHSFVILQKKYDRRDSQSNAVMGLSNSLVDDGNKSSSSGNRDSLELKSMDSTRIRGAEIMDTNQEHKKRCFEKLVVRTERMTNENVKDVKCSLQVEVIDDTALIEATAAVSGFKNPCKKETDVGSGNIPENLGGSRNPKQENDVKKRRNKGSKKQGKGKECSMKCVKEKKLNVQVVEDQNAKQKKIPDRKRQNGFKKTNPKVKIVYRRKDSNNPNPVPTDVQEYPKVETETEPEKTTGGSFEEPGWNLNASNQIEEELTMELVETEPVIENDDGFDLNPKKNEEEDQNVRENTNVESKKMAYTREEIEALRLVNEDEQKNKWAKIFDGFSPSVAKEYTSLLSDMNKQQTQRYNRVASFGSTSSHHAILSMPPVLPLCSSSTYKRIAPYVHTGFRVNFP